MQTTDQQLTENGRTAIAAIRSGLESVMAGQQQKIRWLISAFASGGHMLLEDVPGTGKTTIAKAFAKLISADFKRVQFTPDLLPSDIVGMSVFSQQQQQFQFRPGPVFTHILLADEINRASPRTQSALLEAMAERQVSVEGTLHQLDQPFFVIATQNPVEFHGTYPLPEAQLDRFAMRCSLGYLTEEQELSVLLGQVQSHPLERISATVTMPQVLQLLQAVSKVRCSEELQRYIVALVAATRSAAAINLGASPRASLTLLRTAQALALIDNSDFVTPDHIRELAEPVIAHRLVLDAEARFSGQSASAIVQQIVDQTAIPA